MLPRMPTFNQLIHAAECGFTYDGRTDLFFRFTARADRGYDVEVARADAIGGAAPSPSSIHLTDETLQRLLVTSPDLHTAVTNGTRERWERSMRLYLNEHGHVPDPENES